MHEDHPGKGTKKGREGTTMSWQEAAQSIISIETADLESFALSADEKAEFLTLYNRSLANIQGGDGDIAQIAMKKVLTRCPDWGEALLIFAIGLALEDNVAKAGSVFEHILKTGFINTDYSQVTEYCLGEVHDTLRKQRMGAGRREDGGGFSSMFKKKKSDSIFKEPQGRTMPGQTPILTRVPKNAAKVRFATDVERRNIMMQANAPETDQPDDDLEVDIPKTPAEKIRRNIWITVGALVVVVLGLAVWYFGIPWFQKRQANSAEQARNGEKLAFIIERLEGQRDIPQIQDILTEYAQRYPN